MEFQGWVSIEGAPLSRKWTRVESERVEPIEGLKTPKEILVWMRKNIVYQKDEGNDYWQTPAETLDRKIGDCEDFAILGRALLMAAGFDETSLWVLVGRDLIAREDHAVLVFEEKFVLDNRTDKVQLLSSYTDFLPVVAYAENRAVIFGRRL